MKFEYIREFVTAAGSPELQIAAKELGISTSALSKHIKALEHELGVSLFKRSRKTVLSPYGKLFLPYAGELAALQDEYSADFSDFKENRQYHLVIGLTSIQIRERSGHIIERFATTHSNVDIAVMEAKSSELTALLKNGKCDMVFIRTYRTTERDPELVYLPFCADNMVAFIPPEHPLANEKSVSFDQLKKETIIFREMNSAIYREFISECEKNGFTPNVSFCSSYVSYDMVRRGEGITLYFSAPASAEYGTPLAIVPLRPAVTSYLELVFRRDHINNGIADFVRFVQAHMLDEVLQSDIENV